MSSLSITDTILALVAERPGSEKADWIAQQFALFYVPAEKGGDVAWLAMVGGSAHVLLGEAEAEFIGKGVTAEEALANLRAKMTACSEGQADALLKALPTMVDELNARHS